MKKLLLILIASFIAIAIHAELRYKSLDNFHGKTTVVLEDWNWIKGTQVSHASFNDDDKTYDAKSMVTVEKGDTMTITMTFKKLTFFKEVSVTLNLDNEEVTIPIDLTHKAYNTNTYPNCR